MSTVPQPMSATMPETFSKTPSKNPSKNPSKRGSGRPATSWLTWLGAAALVLASVPALAGGSPAVSAAPPSVALGAPAAVGASEQLTLQLAESSAERSGLQALSTAHGLSHEERVRTFDTLLPASSVRARVQAVVQADGLTVGKGGPLSVTVSGPTARVRAIFGAPRRSAGGWDGGRAIPTNLAGLVSYVVGAADLPTPVPLDTAEPDPTQVGGPLAQTIYHAPARRSGGSSLTVATFELSGWRSAAITDFAADNGLPDPIASGQVAQVPVMAGIDPATWGNDWAAHEVALDTEAVLAADPNAQQRVYFAPDWYTFFASVTADALSTAPDFHLVAMSASYGWSECPTAPEDVTALTEATEALAAAGVTYFDGSGDAGNIKTCTGEPGATPASVNVGGTLAQTVNQDPSTLVETGWTGSGGGYTIWPRPAYQDGVSSNPLRSIPDIAVSANGFPKVDVDPDGTVERYLSGGTSLSGPLAAGLFTDMLDNAGVQQGIGDIHAGLYAAEAADPAAFRDITSGNNGFPAGPGYDLVTGLGAPNWAELMKWLVPSAQLDLAVGAPVTASSSIESWGWAAAEATDGMDYSTATSNGFHSSYGPVQSTTQWVQVDLGTARRITQVVLSPSHPSGFGAGFGFPVDFTLQASNDPTFGSGVVSLAARTGYANPGDAAQAFAVDSVAGYRYLRLTSTKLGYIRTINAVPQYALSLAELSVFSTQAPASSPPVTAPSTPGAGGAAFTLTVPGGGCAGVSAANVKLWAPNVQIITPCVASDPDAQWTLDTSNASFVQLVNKATGKCVDSTQSNPT